MWTSGRLIVSFAIPAASPAPRLVADVGVAVCGRLPSASSRRLRLPLRTVHEWLLAARRPRSRPDRARGTGAVAHLRRSCSRAAVGAARALQHARGRPRTTAGRARAAGRARTSSSPCTAACWPGSTAVPVDLRLSDAERAGRRAQADLSSPSHWAVRTRARWWPSGTADDAPRPLAVMHTSGTTSQPKPVALTHAQLPGRALGSAVALGLDPAERWLCPMPLTHVGGLSIPIRSAIYATTVVLHGTLRHRGGAGRADGPGPADHARLARADDAGAAARRRPAARRRRCAGRCSAADRSRPRCWRAPQDAGVPVAPTYGMTEACSQIATFGYPLPGVELIDHRRRDPRSRPDRRRGGNRRRRLAAHRRSGPLDDRGRLTDDRAQLRHDRHRRRERRAGRGRGGTARTPRCRRRRRARAPRPRVG